MRQELSVSMPLRRCPVRRRFPLAGHEYVTTFSQAVGRATDCGPGPAPQPRAWCASATAWRASVAARCAAPGLRLAEFGEVGVVGGQLLVVVVHVHVPAGRSGGVLRRGARAGYLGHARGGAEAGEPGAAGRLPPTHATALASGLSPPPAA